MSKILKLFGIRFISSKYSFLVLFFTVIFSFSTAYGSLFFINNKDEIETGYKQYSTFEKVENEKVLTRVEEIGHRLSKVSRQRKGIDYIFSVVEGKNAFSGFAGFIYIGQPVYELLTTDDQIAFVIAHEMAHADNRDTADIIEQEFAQRFKDEKLNITISEEMLDDFFFNRIQEYRADSQAILYLFLAGYDPEAGIQVMDKLQNEFGSYQPGLEEVTDHPSFVSRKRNIEAFIKEMRYIEKYYYNDGQRYLDKGAYDKAIRNLSGFLALYYNSFEGFYKRANAYFQKSLIGVETPDYLWFEQKGFEPSSDRKTIEGIDRISLIKAKDDLEAAKRLNPNKVQLYSLLGAVSAELGETKDAIKYFNLAAKKDPNNCSVNNNLGVFYLKQQKLNESKKYLEASIKKCPKNSRPNYNLGQLYLSNGDKNQAKKYFGKVVSFNEEQGYWTNIAKKKLEEL